MKCRKHGPPEKCWPKMICQQCKTKLDSYFKIAKIERGEITCMECHEKNVRGK